MFQEEIKIALFIEHVLFHNYYCTVVDCFAGFCPLEGALHLSLDERCRCAAAPPSAGNAAFMCSS